MQKDAISVLETPQSTQESTTRRLPWTRQDTTWMLSLFGTAVGAGI
ncbi:MAG: HAAAP family serine/threonine permease, partial [Shewanella sp.]